MKIKEIRALGIQKLNENNIDDAIYKANKLLQYILKIKKIDFILKENEYVDIKIEKKYIELLDELIKGKPLQYITHSQEFMKLNFFVDENVLIPQPDTEILVEKALELIKDSKNMSILDLCTGSGAIAISIKRYMNNVNMYASDISKKALNIARLNAKNNDTEIQFIESNMFENIKNLKFDIIVSNPPYIETDDIINLPKDVQNEPILALDGGLDGLTYYKIIRDNGCSFLKHNGKILIEIGYNQNNRVVNLFKENRNYKNIEIYKDLSNIDRVIKIEKS